jgi:hypothetical protein
MQERAKLLESLGFKDAIISSLQKQLQIKIEDERNIIRQRDNDKWFSLGFENISIEKVKYYLKLYFKATNDELQIYKDSFVSKSDTTINKVSVNIRINRSEQTSRQLIREMQL